MKRRMAGALAACLLLVAAPAFAAVENPDELISPSQARALERQLDRRPDQRFEVAFVAHAPDGAVEAARRLFAAKRLGRTDGAIVVAVGDRRIGVHLGDDFAARGLDGRAIGRLIAQDFAPAARQGDYVGGVQALVSDFDAPLRPVGFPWWLLALPLAGIGGYWWLSRRGKRRTLAERLATLREAQGRMLTEALQLEDLDHEARYYEGETAEAYAALARRAAPLMGDVGQLGTQIDQARTQLKHGRLRDAALALETAELRVVPLEAALAGVLTACHALAEETGLVNKRLPMVRARLRAGDSALADKLARAESLAQSHDPASALGLIDEVLAALTGAPVQTLPPQDLAEATQSQARRWQSLAQSHQALLAAAERLNLPEPPGIADPLEEAKQLLTTSPADPQRARARLDEAQKALETFHTELAEAARRAGLPPLSAPTGGWLPGPILMTPPYLLGDWGPPADQSSLGDGWDASGGGGWDTSGGGGWSDGGGW
ncbi:MAG TPA: TPM domain-containing protein [Oscillatoriaceae cyanobacterium]